MNIRFSRNLVVFMCLISIFGCGCGRPGVEEKGNAPLSAVQDSAELVVRGELISLEDSQITPPFRTEVLSLLPEGTVVKVGEKIAELSPEKRLETLHEKKLEAELNALAVERDLELVSLTAKVNDINQQITEVGVAAKQVELEMATSGRDWRRIVELEESVVAEKVRSQMLKKQAEAGAKMAARGFVARQELAETQKNFQILEINASLTTRLIPFLESEPDQKRVFTANQELQKAQMESMVASLSNLSSMVTLENSLRQSKRSHEASLFEIDRLEREIASLTVAAHENGMVIYGNTYDGNSFVRVKAGALVYPGVPYLRIVDRARGGIGFALDQRDSMKLATDASLLFRPDSFPEKLIECHISTVVPVALDITGARPDGRKEVAVKAAIASTPEFLRIGSSGTIFTSTGAVWNLSAFDGSRSCSVVRKKLERKISTTGDVKPVNAVSVVTNISNAKLNQITEEGKAVKAGEVIAVIGNEELEQKSGEAEINLRKKKEEYDLQLQKNEIDTERLNRTIEVRHGALEVARLKHRSLLNSRDDDKITDLKKQIELLVERRSLAKEKISHLQQLRQKGLSSELELMQAESELATIIKDLKVNTYQLRSEESGPSKREIRRSELDVRRAELEKSAAEADAAINIYRNQMAAKLLMAEIKTLEAKLEQLKKQIESAKILAPSAGVVIHNEFNKQGGVGKARVGEKLNPGIPFVQVADLSNLQLHTSVSEMDVKFIKPGDEVKITHKGAGIRTFRGWVSSIGLVAALDIKKRQDSMVPVVIDLLAPDKGVDKIDAAFRPGITCEIEFVMYELDDALTVPFDAIIPTATASCVLTPSRELRPVTLLFSDGLRDCVIAEGLSAGETLLLPGGNI